MFETAELGRALSKAKYDKKVPKLRTTMLEVQRQLVDADFPVIVLLAGLDRQSQAEVVNLLHEWMDARYMDAIYEHESTEEERHRPQYWRYWMALPPKGRLCIFMGTYYEAALRLALDKKGKSGAFERALNRANDFERTLVADGALVIKIWLHLSKKDLRRRTNEELEDKATRWRVSKADKKMLDDYSRARHVGEDIVRRTSSGDAPWMVIESFDDRYRNITVAEYVLESVRRRLGRERNRRSGSMPVPVADPRTILDTVDLDKKLDEKTYDKQLLDWQGRLHKLAAKAEKREVGIISLFEGWDAAGKGGAVRRILKALDAWQYRVIPIAAPTDEEKAHHYLWRFWRHLPRLGRVTIYDRSWYGRVLVERVEGFADESEWMRAYAEINDFEQQLVEHGIVLFKFWMHISQAEQLRRFKEREETPWKKHKITAEDYRNRDKWRAYEVAASEMIGRTSTDYAPWHLIANEDKRWGRVQVLKTLCERLEEHPRMR